LSPLDLVTAGATWAWLAAACATAGLVWHGMGRPPPPLRGSGRSVALALADPVVAVLAAVTALCVLYATALAVATPENEGDALAYHVPRAAFWHQSHAVGYVAGAVDPRLDFNPPNAEIGQLFTMLVSGTQRCVGVVQLVSLLACLVATVGIARRLRFTRSEALFAGLLLLSLPVVLTHSWTALNDLVVASTLLVASYFILGERRVDTLLAALAISLAITTKLTAPPALVLVVLLALAAPGERSRRLKRTAVALLAGVAGGCAWYVVTLRQTGKLDGGMASETG
jgi:hypothetical protein